MTTKSKARLLRVLMVLNRYHPMVGGAERQCRQLIPRLRANGIQVVGVVTHRYDAALASEETLDAVPLHRVGEPARAGAAPVSYYRALLPFLFRRAAMYDVIHCHTAGFAGMLVAIAGSVLGKPVLLKLTAAGELRHQIEGTTSLRWKDRVTNAIRRGLSGFALSSRGIHLVALTAAGAEECRAAGVKQVNVVPNGVDTDHFRPAVSRPTSDRAPAVFGYAGRLSTEKGVETMAAVFERLLSAGAQIRLQVVGSAQLQLRPSEALDQLGKRHPGLVGIQFAVPDTVRFLQGLDCYFSASTYEGMPNAVLEAIACGLPCILSDIDAHREIKRLNPDAWIDLFGPDDVETCCSIVRRFTTLAPRPTSTLLASLTLDAVAARYSHLYAGMVNHPAVASPST